MEMKTILSYKIGEDTVVPAIVKIHELTSDELPDTVYLLTWGDEYIEMYATVSTALARLAVLQRLAETNWSKSFKQVPDDFAFAANTFMSESIS